MSSWLFRGRCPLTWELTFPVLDDSNKKKVIKKVKDSVERDAARLRYYVDVCEHRFEQCIWHYFPIWCIGGIWSNRQDLSPYESHSRAGLVEIMCVCVWSPGRDMCNIMNFSNSVLNFQKNASPRSLKIFPCFRALLVNSPNPLQIRRKHILCNLERLCGGRWTELSFWLANRLANLLTI